MSSSSRNPRGRTAVSRTLGAVAPLAGAAAALLCLTRTASAADLKWEYNPRVELGAIWDDNFRLTDQPGQEIQVTGASIDGALDIRGIGVGERTLLEFEPRVHSTYFPDESSENATDYYLNAAAERRTQRTVSRLPVTFAEESVVTAELLAADFPGIDLGQTVSGDTGRVSVRNRRRLITAVPQTTFDWTERRHLTFSLQYVDVEYDNKIFEQIGYKNFGGDAGIIFDVSQRHAVEIHVDGQRFSPDNGSEDTTGTGIHAEWRTRATEVTSYYFRLGASHSERDATSTLGEISNTSFNGGVGAAWQFQATRVVLDVLRSTVPSAAGAVVDRDELRFRLTHAFQPRFSGFIAVRGIKTTGLVDDIANVRNRKYAAGTTGFDWRTSRQFTMRGAYDYTWQEFQGEPNDAASNGVNLSLIYEPNRLN